MQCVTWLFISLYSVCVLVREYFTQGVFFFLENVMKYGEQNNLLVSTHVVCEETICAVRAS